MQSAIVLLWRMGELGFRVTVSNGELVIQTPPRKKVSKALQEQIDANLVNLLRVLERTDSKDRDTVQEAINRFQLKPCPSCRRTGYWVSMHGSVACYNCHPPGDKFMARRLLGPDVKK